MPRTAVLQRSKRDGVLKMPSRVALQRHEKRVAADVGTGRIAAQHAEQRRDEGHLLHAQRDHPRGQVFKDAAGAVELREHQKQHGGGYRIHRAPDSVAQCAGVVAPGSGARAHQQDGEENKHPRTGEHKQFHIAALKTGQVLQRIMHRRNPRQADERDKRQIRREQTQQRGAGRQKSRQQARPAAQKLGQQHQRGGGQPGIHAGQFRGGVRVVEHQAARQQQPGKQRPGQRAPLVAGFAADGENQQPDNRKHRKTGQAGCEGQLRKRRAGQLRANLGGERKRAPRHDVHAQQRQQQRLVHAEELHQNRHGEKQRHPEPGHGLKRRGDAEHNH